MISQVVCQRCGILILSDKDKHSIQSPLGQKTVCKDCLHNTKRLRYRYYRLVRKARELRERFHRTLLLSKLLEENKHEK
jgi:hypothetical protein